MADTQRIAQMRASLENFALTPRKDGFFVKFFVELADGDQVLALEQAIQRTVILTIDRRRLRLTPQANGHREHRELPLAFMGADD